MTKENIILNSLKVNEVLDKKKIAKDLAITLQEIDEYFDAAKQLATLGKLKAIGKNKYVLSSIATNKTKIKEVINNAIKKGTSITLTGAKVDGTLYKNEVLFPSEFKGFDNNELLVVKKSDGNGWRSYKVNLIIAAF